MVATRLDNQPQEKMPINNNIWFSKEDGDKPKGFEKFTKRSDKKDKQKDDKEAKKASQEDSDHHSDEEESSNEEKKDQKKTEDNRNQF